MDKKIKALLPAISGTLLVIALILIAIVLQKDGSSSGSSGSGGASDQVNNAPQSSNMAPLQPVTYSEIADVEPIELPDKSPIAEAIGFEPLQTEKLSDKYVLRDTELGDNSITYKYQMHMDSYSRRLYLTITKMTQEEYNNSLPDERVREHVDIDGRDAVYANRILYRVPEEEELTEDSVEVIDEKAGRAIIDRSQPYRELSEIQTLDWYENDCKYEIFADYLNLSPEQIVELALYYYQNGK